MNKLFIIAPSAPQECSVNYHLSEWFDE